MKKLIHFTWLSSAAFAVFLALGMSLATAYAVETPTEAKPAVTINGEPAGVHAEIIDGKLYFSLRDYWLNVEHISPEQITWYGDTQIVSSGNIYLFLKDQTCRGYLASEARPLTDPAVLQNGRILVAPSFILQDSGHPYIGSSILPVSGENSLDFRITFWEGNPQAPNYRVLIPLDAEAGYPNFENNLPWHGVQLNPEDFDITKTETEDRKQVFVYTSKKDKEKTLTVTAWDGYVTHVLEQNEVFYIPVRG